MSLIHDALRKARQETGDDESRGVVYARGLTGRRGRHGVGSGILLGVLLAVIVGGLVGGAIWLRLDHRSRPDLASAGGAGETAASNRLPGSAGRSSGTDTAAAPDPATESPRQQPVAAQSASPPEKGRVQPTPPPIHEQRSTAEPAPGETATARPAPDAASVRPPHPIPTKAPPTPVTEAPGAGERVYDVEADLGYATLTLDYIVYRPTDPFAQINGVDVRVGGTVEGFTLEEIGRTSVRLRDDRGALVLRVP
jgi:hypothetical protein